MRPPRRPKLLATVACLVVWLLVTPAWSAQFDLLIENGRIYDGTGGHFYVELYISDNTECGPYHVTWKQYGDDWGDPPHWIGGDLNDVLCPTATEASTWSSVKSLY